MADVEYTSSQLKAIEDTSNNMLVSAAAGSGKTTIMIERIARLVRDKHVPISRFLCLSFTKASAADMKNKLVKKLSSLEPTPFLLEQLDDIMSADVSNLHSFCARLLKSYFYEAGLDPSFVVLDDDEAQTLKQKALVHLFNQKSEAADADFYELIDIFARSRSDEGLKDAVLELYSFLCSIVDREGFIKQTNAALYDTDLENNTGARVINSHLIAERNRCCEKISRLISMAASANETKLVSYLQELESKVSIINPRSNFVENAKRLEDGGQRMSRIPRATEGREFLFEEAKALKDEIDKRLKKLKDYALVGSVDDIAGNLAVCKRRVDNLYKLTLDFEKEYAALKKERGGLDFNDLEQYTLLVLKNRDILKEINDKYDYVLVDEYQDINHVQEKILSLIAKGDNRFAVGDVKQSIYRFRLCVPEIFLEKYNLYENNKDKGTLVLLNKNFRSKSRILSFVNAVFNRTMTKEFGGVDYEKEAQLEPGDEAKQVDEETRVGILFADHKEPQKVEGEPEIYSVQNDASENSDFSNGQAEGVMVAHKIAELLVHGKIVDKYTKRPRNIRYSDITILTQSRNGHLMKIVETLQSFGIPVSTDIEDDCLEDKYVYGVKSFLDVVGNFKEDYSLFSCMYSKLFGFTADELAAIRIVGNSDNYYYDDVRAALDRPIDDQLKIKLKNFFDALNTARERAKYMTAKEIAEDIVRQQDLEFKMSFEKDFTKHKQKLGKFLASLKDQSLPDYLGEAELSGIKCQPTSAQGSVKVMTIHKSKGLEFGVVFLVMANKGFNFSSMRGGLIISGELGVSINYHDRELRYKESTLAREAVKLLETRKMLEEQQRLLYVALTRATDYLYVVGSGNYQAIKPEFPVSPTCFMDFMGHLVTNYEKYKDVGYDVEILDSKDLIENITPDGGNEVIISASKQEIADQMNAILNKEYAFASSTTLPIKTAVTELIEEGQENLVQSFDGGGSSAELGTLQHKVLEQLNLNEDKPQLERKLDHMVSEGMITPEDRKNVMVDGIVNLLASKEFSEILKGADKVNKECEFFMLHTPENCNDGVVIQGVVDLCVFKRGKMIIVDYKTGSLGQKNIERYTRQLSLYAEAMERCYNRPVERCFIASLNSGKLIDINYKKNNLNV